MPVGSGLGKESPEGSSWVGRESMGIESRGGLPSWGREDRSQCFSETPFESLALSRWLKFMKANVASEPGIRAREEISHSFD